MKLFEVRLSLWTQQYRQRFPQATCSLLARVPSDVLASRALRIVSDNVRDHPPWIPDRVASGAPFGSSPVCLGSVSSRPGFTGDKAALARSVSSGACPLALPTLLCLIFPSQSVRSLELLLRIFSPQLGPVNWRGLSQSQVDFKNMCSKSWSSCSSSGPGRAGCSSPPSWKVHSFSIMSSTTTRTSSQYSSEDCSPKLLPSQLRHLKLSDTLFQEETAEMMRRETLTI